MHIQMMYTLLLYHSDTVKTTFFVRAQISWAIKTRDLLKKKHRVLLTTYDDTSHDEPYIGC